MLVAGVCVLLVVMLNWGVPATIFTDGSAPRALRGVILPRRPKNDPGAAGDAAATASGGGGGRRRAVDEYPVLPLPPDRADKEPLKEGSCYATARVFDIVTLVDEFDLYEVRVAELFDVVDVFVVVVASDKVNAAFQRVVTQLPERFRSKLHSLGCTFDDRESGAQQRRQCLQDAVADRRASRGDLVILGHADEILVGDDVGIVAKLVNAARCRPHRNHLRTNVDTLLFPMEFRLTTFYYNFRWISRAAQATAEIHMFDGDARNLRSPAGDSHRGGLVFGQGWRCAWCFGTLSRMRAEMRDLLGSRSEVGEPRAYTRAHLLAATCKGDEPFGAGVARPAFARSHMHNVSRLPENEAMLNAPRYLRKNLRRLSYLMPPEDKPCGVKDQ